ncbi:hypothetical protein KOR34_47180 [Posidoniimonas corsicana]|uniref:PEP-CTERM protein-sorting domain-containing protein n=2 Tax=Posidoniimonas corsicana TaxID=1938618 RepID=A0A5C5UX50_9BACT|nr:hypothetical protein KOR34_47180 [Posidoniimonas corsicana]
MMARFLACVWVLAWAGVALAQSDYSLAVRASRFDQSDGSAVYGFQFTLSPTLLGSVDRDDDVELSITMPNGFRHEEVGSLGLVATKLDDLRPSAMAALAGSWTILERSAVEDHTYQFTLPNLTNPTLWGDAPAILSPLDGEVVPRVFDVATTVEPPSFRYELPSQEVSVSSEWLGGGAARFTIDGALDPEGGVLGLLASQWTGAPLPVANLMGSDPAAFNSTLTFIHYGAPIHLTVVPEPGAATLVELLLVAGVAGRRRFR